MAVLTVKTIC